MSLDAAMGFGTIVGLVGVFWIISRFDGSEFDPF